MRIISGNLKGRPIQAPTGRQTRPTSDKARGAIFNVISHASWAPDISGASVLDIFAGSGALGLEALSRGAAKCMFVETGAAARKSIQSNIRAFGLETVSYIDRRSALKLGNCPEAHTPGFSLVFLDPPYNQGLVLPTLSGLLRGEWLSPDALVVVETGANETFDFQEWNNVDTRTYGAAKFSCLTISDS